MVLGTDSPHKDG